MSTPISFIEIPKVPMEHIFEFLDFQSILVLRKVCHDLRNFIDDTKPASHLTEIQVTVRLESKNFSISSILNRNRNEIIINYVKQEEGCLVKCYKESQWKETILENEDFVTIFCKDFDIVMRHQKTVLLDIGISFTVLDSTVNDRVLEGVNKSLKSLNHPLQTKSLYMKVDNHNEILPVLQHMDPKVLKEIIIFEFPSRRGNILNLDKIGQLEQWKQADQLVISGFRLPDLTQNVKHFSRFTSRLRFFNNEELLLLKEIILSSTTLHTVEIFVNRADIFIIKPKLIETFGNHFLDTDQGRSWFFRLPDMNKFISIKYKYMCIAFTRIEQSDVPQNAIILN